MTRSGFLPFLSTVQYFPHASWILKLAMELFSPYILPEMHRLYVLLWVTSNYTPICWKDTGDGVEGDSAKHFIINIILAVITPESSSSLCTITGYHVMELSLKAFCSSLKYAVPLYLQTANQSTKKGQSWCLNAVSNFTFAYPVNHLSLSSQKT